MPPFPFTVLAEKLGNAYQAMQASFVLFPDPTEEPDAPAWFTVVRNQQQSTPQRLQISDDSSFSSEGTYHTGSFRSMIITDDEESKDMTVPTPIATFEPVISVCILFHSFKIDKEHDFILYRAQAPTRNDVR
jgi:hypothetical protein